jgi:di/tricarboxylate transporter
MVILEAMAASRPVVATDVGSIGAEVVGGVTGRLVPRGDASALADGLVDVVGDLGPRALLLGLVLLVFVLGQLISNMATALIVIPIAVSAAAELDVSAKPVLMAVCVAAAAAFITPVATPANLMVMEPGGYRFGDYWKLGLPMLVLFGLVAVLLVPVIWSF